MLAGKLFYNILILAAGALAFPWAAYRLLLAGKRRAGLAQRLGASPLFSSRTIWCHAVSVGEVRAMTPLLTLLEKDGRTRGRIILSTVTATGQDAAGRECRFVERIFYFPLDLPFVVGRALGRANPEVFISAETEIWPNFFFACFRKSIPVVIVNGRISDRSYSRYMRFRWFFRPILEKVTLFLMQSNEDARRIREIGARPETVKVTGNMKYDRVPEPVSLPEAVTSWARGGFLLVAGSTHAGEEAAVLETVGGNSNRNILLALVPRHPERFEEVARLLDRKGVSFTTYSAILKGGAVEGKVILVDAMGVLDGFYALADTAFVGGSLVPVGGHNLLEPAMHGVPVVTGHQTQNFRDIVETLSTAGGCMVVQDSESLGDALRGLLDSERKRDEMGRANFEASKRYVGASEDNLSRIIEILQ